MNIKIILEINYKNLRNFLYLCKDMYLRLIATLFLVPCVVGFKSVPTTTFDKYRVPSFIKDTVILATLIESECGNCPKYEKRLVGQVVYNRINHKSFPNTLREVIFQTNQFYYNHKKFPSKETYKIAKDILKAGIITEILYFYNPVRASDTVFIKSVNVLQKGKYHLYGA